MPPIIDILDFEDSWRRRHDGVKEEAIRARFGIPPARYYQLLERAIDTREAMESRPMITRRLLRLRAVRDGERQRRVAG